MRWMLVVWPLLQRSKGGRRNLFNISVLGHGCQERLQVGRPRCGMQALCRWLLPFNMFVMMMLLMMKGLRGNESSPTGNKSSPTRRPRTETSLGRVATKNLFSRSIRVSRAMRGRPRKLRAAAFVVKVWLGELGLWLSSPLPTFDFGIVDRLGHFWVLANKSTRGVIVTYKRRRKNEKGDIRYSISCH